MNETYTTRSERELYYRKVCFVSFVIGLLVDIVTLVRWVSTLCIL